MLKILKIKVKGFKLLEDNFEINFINKARVYEKDIEKEVLPIENGLYTFRSIAYVGSNSSGKSSVLLLILKTGLFLQTGRWEYSSFDFKNNKIDFEILFYLDNYIYLYNVSFCKIDNAKISLNEKYCSIENENLKVLKFDKTKGNKNIDLAYLNSKEVSDSILNSLYDTSSITNLTKKEILIDEFNTNNIINFNETIVKNSFFDTLNNCNARLSSSIIKLLDDSIEYILIENLDTIRFKRINDNELILSKFELMNILSAGTFRGVELYIRAINALKFGKIFIVDEIENCFQKNLVYNLLFLFNDAAINKKGAQLIFSTHYIEILDYFNRRDNINITYKEDGIIKINNLYSDFDVRTELLKSKQFDNNVFNTALNYKQLMEVRRNIIDELHTNND